MTSKIPLKDMVPNTPTSTLISVTGEIYTVCIVYCSLVCHVLQYLYNKLCIVLEL